MLAQLLHHHQADTIHAHSVWLGTWYHAAHGHCLAIEVFVVFHQLFVVSVFDQSQFVKILLHTKLVVSVLAFNHTLQEICVDCCVESLKAKPLLLHHWK